MPDDLLTEDLVAAFVAHLNDGIISVDIIPLAVNEYLVQFYSEDGTGADIIVTTDEVQLQRIPRLG